MADQLDTTFLYAAGGTMAACAALCFSVPETLAVESFGESAKDNKQLIHVFGPLGAMMSISSITWFALAMGKDAAAAAFAGFSVIPFRMAYDLMVGIPPPKVMMAMSGAVFALGAYTNILKK
mmetsp:Transcript_25649/g.72491  ORF Transcript_25649/g.72491 Transcript_25649/m.72491 type:complete len:122 (-) Transcript_25649:180-545(-)